jgi:carbonic anhydrase/acetyltransferase-like protein (isoleucine patch superfamily)
MALLHGCEIGEGTLVGMGATIMNGAKIGKNCLIGARSLVGENKVIPDGSLVLGMPAKVIRMTTTTEIAMIQQAIDHYVGQALRHRHAISV